MRAWGGVGAREARASLSGRGGVLAVQVLGAVEARGHSLGSDTVACFFSDHGEMLDDHDDRDKSKPWQGALAVPLVCAGPGMCAGLEALTHALAPSRHPVSSCLRSPRHSRANATVAVPMATVDIGATMLDLAGATLRPQMTARSFRGLPAGGKGSWGLDRPQRLCEEPRWPRSGGLGPH